MFKLFINSFKTTNDCIILATPLIIFMSILGWFFNYTVAGADTIPKIILGGVTLLVMTSGFLSAWIYMAKKAIQLSRKIIIFDKDRSRALKTLVLSLPKGIGRLFLPMLGVIGIYLIIYGTIFSLITIIITHLSPEFDPEILGLHLSQLVTSNEIIKEINELSIEELAPFVYWHILTMFSVFIVNFITILWIPEIVYAQKNAFKALWNAIVKNITNFPKTCLLYICISILIALITILSTILMFNPILYFIVLILYYYFLVYIVVLLFSYYEQAFIRK